MPARADGSCNPFPERWTDGRRHVRELSADTAVRQLAVDNRSDPGSPAADAEEADWTTLETITLSPVDADPTDPAIRNFTTELASDTVGLWYRIVFGDADGDLLLPTVPIQNVAPVSPVRDPAELARILKIRATADAGGSYGQGAAGRVR